MPGSTAKVKNLDGGAWSSRLCGAARALAARLTPTRGHRAVFTRMYRRNAWGNGESASGPGSTRERADAFQAELVELLRRLETRTLLDAPCGDFNWMAPVADVVERYVGVDVVAGLVEANARRHAAANRTFVCADLTRDALPAAEVILCRDCLVHFSFADALRAVANFRRSGATWLLATTFVAPRRNADVRTGGWRPLNLEEPPFRFPAPVAVVDEQCLRSGGIYRDKRLALWRLDALPG
jgi:hypothetical protein